jgi:hypothetical protein
LNDITPFSGFMTAGYHIVSYIPYGMTYSKELYKGSYFQCLLVLHSLNSFSLN